MVQYLFPLVALIFIVMSSVNVSTLKRVRGQKLAGLTRVRRRALVLIDTSGSKTQLTALMKELDDSLQEVVQANAEYMTKIEQDETEVANAVKYEEDAEAECTKVQEKIHAHLKSREGEPGSVTSRVSGQSKHSKASSARDAEIDARVLELEEAQLRARQEKEREKEELQRQLLLQEKRDELQAAQLKAELTKAAESELTWERKDDFKDEKQAQDERQTQQDRHEKEKCEESRAALSKLPLDEQKKSTTAVPAASRGLPRLSLRTFSGNPGEWPAWYGLFNALVHNDSSLSMTEKMVYLQSSVGGIARDLISGMLCDPNLYEDALQTLRERFGREQDVVQAKLNAVFGRPSPTMRTLESFYADVNSAVTVLESLGYAGDLESQENLRRLVEKLPGELKREWAKHMVSLTVRPNLIEFNKWLKLQVRIALNCLPTSISEKPGFTQVTPRRGGRTPEPRVAAAFVTTTQKFNCVCCGSNHKLWDCSTFKNKHADERIQVALMHRCCFSCLKVGHRSRDCKTARICGIDGCYLKHNRLLHGSKRVRTTTPGTQTSAGDRDQRRGHSNEHTVASVTGAGEKCSSVVLLQVVPVRVQGKDGRHKDTLALLDPGAQTSLCQEGLLEELGIQGEPQPLILHNVEADGQEKISRRVKLELSPLAVTEDRDQLICVPEAYSVKKVNVRTPSINKRWKTKWKHLEDLALPDCTKGEVEILLGANVLEAILQKEARVGRSGEPVAIRTAFGWSLTGSIAGFAPSHTREVMFVHTSSQQKGDRELSASLADWWSTEAFGTLAGAEPVLPPEEEKAMKILEKTTRHCGDRYEVGLLWKDEEVVMPDNYAMACQRLKSLEKSLMRDPKKAELYGEVLEGYVKQGYARKLEPEEMKEESSKRWILPHHAVMRPEKPKPRVVFDAAAELNGTSLNSELLKGPDLLQNLAAVLLRFRQEKCALVADVHQMFHQIRVRPSDQPALSFLWQGLDMSRSPDLYQMLVVIFGARCSPSIANYIMRRTLSENPATKLSESEQKTLCSNFYMDDFLRSEPTVEAAQTTREEVTHLLKRGGFHLTKWRSSHPEVLDEVAEVDKDPSQKTLTPNKDLPQKALGCAWSPSCDTLSIHVKDVDVASTKRGVLKKIAMIFDPLGLISPFVLRIKVLVQKLWALKLDWDEQIPDAELSEWEIWLRELPNLRDIAVPRCLLAAVVGDVQHIELHMFSDASEQAFAAVGYVRVTDASGHHHTSLIMARSRLAPLKQLSIVRLELQAAVLATRLARTIRGALGYEFEETFFWCDSQAVLQYIANESRVFHTFVANRTAEIRDASNSSDWRHVPGFQNPADVLTRGMSAHQLQGSKLWWTGPEFLKLERRDWPTLKIPGLPQDDPELKKKVVKSSVSLVEKATVSRLVDPARFSSWSKLRRVVAWVQRYIWNVRSKRLEKNKRSGPLTMQELENAENFIIREDQARQRLPAPPGLSLIRDEQEVVRVTGRLRHAPVEVCQQPIILSPDSELTRLMVLDVHLRVMHSGLGHALNEFRKKYWTPKARSVIKKIIWRCAFCRNRRAGSACPRMANLPKERFDMSRPFSSVGLDFLGPLYVRKYRKTEKRYVLLVTCLSTRAIHLEVAHSMDTDSFLLAFRRFVGRRGEPKCVWSDNGSNLVSGERELREALRAWNQQQIVDALSQKDIEWKFNPPSASHMGGVWERLVASVKRAVKAVLGKQVVSDEVLLTTITEVEYMLNSRPLTYVSGTCDEPEAITPNHFLLGARSPSALPPGTFSDDDLLSRKRWRHTQALADHIWRRWIREYVPTLISRKKWNADQPNIAVNDVVLLATEDSPRGYWPLGVVEEVFPGEDGIVRSALVRTSGGVYRRPSTKICLIERRESV